MFNFRLQRVLDLRAKREQEVAVKLAEARDRADDARRAQAALEAVRTENRERLAHAHGGGRTVGQLRSLGFVLESLDRRITDAAGVVEAADAGVHASMLEMSDAFRDRRVLDRLRERHLESWRIEEVQQDRAAMDAIALTRFVQKGAGEGGR
ncbi:MAG TPA: flagellar export protein FliJ [Longimicrobiaceae bacterium]